LANLTMILTYFHAYQVLPGQKFKLKDIILSQYRSQRAFAGVLTGRKNLRPDNLKSTTGNSRLITVRSFADLTKAEHGEAIGASSPEASNETVVPLNGGVDNKSFQHKLEHLKDRYTYDQAGGGGGEKSFEVESFLIMTGEVGFLSRHVIAFIRLMDEHFVCK
jgi:hypothetical protein